MVINPDQTYVQKVNQTCSKIDSAVKKYLINNRFIEENNKIKEERVKALSGFRLIILYVLAMIAVATPILIISIFTNAYILLSIPALAFLLTISCRTYYQKKLVPIHENAYEKIVTLAKEDVCSAIDELTKYKGSYESDTSRIPDRLRHEIALNILHEAIRQGYASDLNEAITFYKKHLAAVEKDKSDAALQIINEIETSEKKIDERIKVFTVI